MILAAVAALSLSAPAAGGAETTTHRAGDLVVYRFACPKWVHLLGTNPQTGQPIDCFDCADQWASVLTIEAAKETRQTAAAIESFRNEMVRGQQEFVALVTRPRLVGMGHGRDDRK